MEKIVIELSSDDEDEKLREAKRRRKCSSVESSARSIKFISRHCTEDEYKVLSDMSGFQNLAAMMAEDALLKRIKKNRKKKKVDVAMERKQPDTDKAVETTKALEPESVQMIENPEPQKHIEEKQVIVKGIETTTSYGKESVQIEHNTVLQKLLRGPRYFDLPENGWDIRFHFGEESHPAVNHTGQKRKKPCFFCGCLEHSGKQCKQGRDCFFCKGIGHIAKDCPEKQQNNLCSKVCLRCGDLGHDMWSCNGDYSPDDLQEIQCYVCKSSGHLCCFDFPDMGTEQASCYNCGLSGHLGPECTISDGNTSGSRSPAKCSRGGEEGHFAEGCKNNAKVEKTAGNLLSPPKSPEQKRDFLGSKSVPQDIYKAQKNKECKYQGRVSKVAGQSWWRNGWIADRPVRRFCTEARENVWLSPSLSAKKNQEISALSANGHFSSYQTFSHHPASSS